MDDLIDELMELYESYSEARAEMKECFNDCEVDAGYFCYHHSQKCDEYKDKIKETIKKIVDFNKEG